MPCGSPPEADPGGPYSEIVNTVVQFDGSNSFDPDGDTITDYQWDFGDGSTGTGVAPTHTYTTVGAYTVRLVVVANGDSSSSASTTVDVVGNPPVADAGGPYSGTIMGGGGGGGATIIFDGSASFDPDGDIITSYEWDFGDGAIGTGVAPSYTYTVACPYTVTLTVTANGDSGQASTTATITQMGGGGATPVCP